MICRSDEHYEDWHEPELVAAREKEEQAQRFTRMEERIEQLERIVAELPIVSATDAAKLKGET